MIRYSDDIWMRCNAVRESARYSQAAHQLVMNRITEGRVELSTLQALCLLSLTEFYNADQVKSRIHSSLAITLASCANLKNSAENFTGGVDAEERSRCYWSIILLRRLLGESTTSLDTQYRRSPSYPESPCMPPMAAVSPEGQRIASRSGLKSEGIVATVIKLSEVWSATQDYVRARGSSEPAVVPWSPDSKYSATLRKLMDLGQKLPPLHRYRCIKPSSLTANDLEEARDYWAPWFLSRFLYHTIICLLNHPFLITMQMQGIQGVSEVFLQQTTFSITHHTSWFLHFIAFLEARQFRITDPFFGYCAAVVATIQVQQSFWEEGRLGQKKRDNYNRCLKFIQKIGQEWELMNRMADKLQTPG
ncbi:c6 zinc finger domain containing protein [Penicillium digitatum]|uniref:C6 zinc finger domain containing protein n=1 Tax=Penicillium digitatum TaxID=36651 RepID=A0A7T7BH40_PENDI|nr:c6 zinc finger domain containing protein [Penicillium digitatum]